MPAQDLVGGPKPFEAFLKAYVQAHRFSVHTSDSLRSFFCNFFRDEPALQQIDWDTWFHKPGECLKETKIWAFFWLLAVQSIEWEAWSHKPGKHLN